MSTILDHLADDQGGPTEGERRRDLALARLRGTRSGLVRRLMRALLTHLIEHGADTSDAVRAIVPIPPGTDPRVVGSAVRALAEAGLITSIDRRRSHRPQAHARQIDVWRVTDEVRARYWLTSHPEIDPPTDPSDPYAAAV